MLLFRFFYCFAKQINTFLTLAEVRLHSRIKSFYASQMITSQRVVDMQFLCVLCAFCFLFAFEVFLVSISSLFHLPKSVIVVRSIKIYKLIYVIKMLQLKQRVWKKKNYGKIPCTVGVVETLACARLIPINAKYSFSSIKILQQFWCNRDFFAKKRRIHISYVIEVFFKYLESEMKRKSRILCWNRSKNAIYCIALCAKLSRCGYLCESWFN